MTDSRIARTLIIAEAGVNHNGDLDLGRRLIDVAAQAGADLVKFQTFRADDLVIPSAEKAAYQTMSTGQEESQHAMLRRLELTREMHEALINHCAARGIRFFSTAFDLESLNLLNELGLDRFKTPSGEITNFPYLQRVASFGKPVILSTGMSTMEEIESALGVLVAGGVRRDEVTVLHCNTEYPTPFSDVNLHAMVAIRDRLGVPVGYSDHTLGIEVAVAAVALGATVIEKHFTMDRTLPGPDHKASLEPKELTALVAAVRNVELAMGDGIKRPSPSERKNMSVARKSIVAARDIRAGEVFSAANLAVKRPGTGLSPMRWEHVIGKRASRDFSTNDLIEL